MKNKMLYGFLTVSALILMPYSVLADTGSTNALYQSPGSSFGGSVGTSLRQPIGTNRLVTKKSTYQPQVSSTLSSSSPNSQDCLRPGAFRYRQGYQSRSPFHKVTRYNKPALPGHIDTASVPELDADISQNAFVLLFGGVLVLRARKRRNKQS
jgi:hypothetical protein